MTIFPPKRYDGKKGEEVKHIKRFEEVCVILAQRLNRNPKEMKAFEFMQALKTIKAQDKPKKGKGGSPGKRLR
jgi:hypothetical protein